MFSKPREIFWGGVGGRYCRKAVTAGTAGRPLLRYCRRLLLRYCRRTREVGQICFRSRKSFLGLSAAGRYCRGTRGRLLMPKRAAACCGSRPPHREAHRETERPAALDAVPMKAPPLPALVQRGSETERDTQRARLIRAAPRSPRSPPPLNKQRGKHREIQAEIEKEREREQLVVEAEAIASAAYAYAVEAETAGQTEAEKARQSGPARDIEREPARETGRQPETEAEIDRAAGLPRDVELDLAATPSESETESETDAETETEGTVQPRVAPQGICEVTLRNSSRTVSLSDEQVPAPLSFSLARASCLSLDLPPPLPLTEALCLSLKLSVCAPKVARAVWVYEQNYGLVEGFADFQALVPGTEIVSFSLSLSLSLSLCLSLSLARSLARSLLPSLPSFCAHACVGACVLLTPRFLAHLLAL